MKTQDVREHQNHKTWLPLRRFSLCTGIGLAMILAILAGCSSGKPESSKQTTQPTAVESSGTEVDVSYLAGCSDAGSHAASSADASSAAFCVCLPAEKDINEIKNKNDVKIIQTCLQEKKYYSGGIDGIAGTLTQKALEQCRADSQKREGGGKKECRAETGEGFISYQLTDDDLERLSVMKGLVAKLTALEGKSFDSGQDVEDAIDKIVKEVTAKSADSKEYVTAVIDKAGSSWNMIPPAKGCDEPPDNTTEAQTCQESFVLSDAFIKYLNKFVVADDVLAGANKLKNVEYPDRCLFENALSEMVSIQPIINLFVMNKEPLIDEHDAVELFAAEDNCDLEEIFQKIINRQKVNKKNEAAGQLQDKIGAKIHELKTLKEKYRGLISLAVCMAKKRHSLDDRHIRWEGAAGCYFDNLSGEIYGIYPFWMGGEPQEIDFSAFTRIGYFAMGFDESGNVANPMNLSSDQNDYRFIDVARRYRTKNDLVVYWNDWRAWEDPDKRTTALNNLAANIVAAMKEKSDESLMNRLNPYVSFGASKVPQMWDGVIIYFEEYPFLDNNSRTLFVDFITKLHNRLYDGNLGHHLTVRLPMPILKRQEGIQLINELIADEVKAMKETGNSESCDKECEKSRYVERFLIPLEEPTSVTKKSIREEIEREFRGESRRMVLRKIVPMMSSRLWISAQVEDRNQFNDDLIYFQDNFGGAGFWPVITANDGAAVRKLSQPIKNTFRTKTDYVSILQDGTSIIANVFNFIGPHRWLIRLAFDLFLLGLLIYAGLALWIYELRNFFWRNIRWFAVVAGGNVLLFLSLLIGDPYYRHKMVPIMFFLVVAMAAICVGAFVRKMKQKDYP